MYARFTEATFEPSKRSQVERIATEDIIPAARKQKGFRGVLFGTNDKGEGVFVSFWDSKQDLEANESSGYYQQQVAKLKDVLSKPTARHAGEVAAHEVSQRAAKAARLTVSAIRAEARQQEREIGGQIAKQAARQEGFCAWFGVVSEESKTLALSAWDSQRSLERSASGYMAEALNKLKERAIEPPRQTILEVVAAQLPTPVGAVS